MTEFERFQELQIKLVDAGFDTTLRGWPDGSAAMVSLTVELHAEQSPELMAKLTPIIDSYGYGMTAKGETVTVTAVK